MTLVVARTNGRQVSIVADTMIAKNGQPQPIGSGMLKSCLIPGGLCVSFAGSPELAEMAIWNFTKCNPHVAHYSQTTEYFRKSSATTGNEYILAFANSGKLTKITNGRKQESVSKTQWIGDKDAYELFRQHENRARQRIDSGRSVSAVLMADEPTDSPASDLYGAMREVVRNRSVPNVGGFASLVSNSTGDFSFPCFSEMSYDWPLNVSENYEIDFEKKFTLTTSGENSGYSLSVFTSSYANYGLVGFYFLKGKIAYVFSPNRTLLSDSCQVLKNVEPQGLTMRLTELFGRDLGWRVWIAGPGQIDDSAISDALYHSRSSGMGCAIEMHCNTLGVINRSSLGQLVLDLSGPAS